MGDLRALMAAAEHLPAHLTYWVMWMQIVLFLGPIVFGYYAAARWMILAQCLNVLIAYCVFVAEGSEITRLFGLGHLAWIFPAWFFVQDARSDKWYIYRGYAVIAATTMIISLVFDFADIFRWIGGERESVLEIPLSGET